MLILASEDYRKCHLWILLIFFCCLLVIFVVGWLEKLDLAFSFSACQRVLIMFVLLLVLFGFLILLGECSLLISLLLIVKVDSLINHRLIMSFSASCHDSLICFGKLVKIVVVIENLIIFDTPDLEFNGFWPENVPDLLHFLFGVEMIVTFENLVFEVLQLFYHFLLQFYYATYSLLLMVSFFDELHLSLLELSRTV